MTPAGVRYQLSLFAGGKQALDSIRNHRIPVYTANLEVEMDAKSFSDPGHRMADDANNWAELPKGVLGSLRPEGVTQKAVGIPGITDKAGGATVVAGKRFSANSGEIIVHFGLSNLQAAQVIRHEWHGHVRRAVMPTESEHNEMMLSGQKEFDVVAMSQFLNPNTSRPSDWVVPKLGAPDVSLSLYLTNKTTASGLLSLRRTPFSL
jgi:hypothetical protein